jgi:phosphatidyl-myo-inositol alpha-mannosyltransferase
VRIGFVLDDRLDSDNGVQQSVKTLGEWLQRSGHEVVAFCGGSEQENAGAPMPAFDRVWTLAFTRCFRFNGNRVDTPTRPRKITDEVIAEIKRCDVLHVQAPYGPLVGHRVICRASPRTKVVASFHMAPLRRHVRIGGRLASVFMRRSATRINSVVCDSPASEELMRSMWKREACEIIGHPLDPGVFDVSKLSKSSKEGEPFRIVCVGRLVERKGCRYLLDALARLPERFRTNLDVRIVGDGPLRAQLMRTASSLALDTFVHFSGRVDEQTKRQLLSDADLAVFPAIGGESFGVVLLEAIGCKTPLLAFNNEGYGYVLRNSPESLVAVRDVDRLALRMTQLMGDPAALRRLRAEQAVAAKEYLVDEVGHRYLDLYAR